jgi:hypothetical protein
MSPEKIITQNQLPNYTWIKFPIGNLNDIDFMGVSDSSLGIYVKLYLLAGRADAGGLLCSDIRVLNAKELAWYLRDDPGIVETAIDELISAGLITQNNGEYRITKFMLEQGPGDNGKREGWRQRQREHRERVSDYKDDSSDEEKETEEIKEEESEKIRIDKNRESRLRHNDVTVTQSDDDSSLILNTFTAKEQVISPVTIGAWKDWNKLVIVARGKGREDIVEKFQPPQDSGWKVIDQQTQKLREEITRI